MAFLDSGFYAHPDLMQPRCRIRRYYDLINDQYGLELISTPDNSMWHGMMTSTVAAACGGEIATIWVAETTVNEAATEPNFTSVAPVKLVPVIVTDVPPPVVPLDTLSELIDGAEAAV